MQEIKSDIRWKQRFQNFEKAFARLGNVIEAGVENLSDLEKEGLVQRFEYTFELGWKTIKDYLALQGNASEEPTARRIIKTAFSLNIIQQGHVWIAMLDQRNNLSHQYDFDVFEQAVDEIDEIYYPELLGFYHDFKKKVDHE